jgi:plasmid segregation protein ParM
MDTAKFKTKTIFKRRNHGDTGDKWCVALDLGYSAVKVFSPNIVAMFPSYAKKETSNYLGEVNSNVILYKNLETGESWTVGDDAQSRIDVRDTQDSEASLYGRERYMTPMFKVLVETGLAIGSYPVTGNSPKGRELFVQTGLPPKYLKADKELLAEVISGRHHFSIRLGAEPEVEFDFTVRTENIDVISQPMGTLFSVMVDNNHRFVPNAEDYFAKNLIVFDPGFGTLDIFPIRQHHVEVSETFDNLGMKRVIEETALAINEKYGQDISVPAMQKYLARGTFRYQKRENGRMVTKDIEFSDILAEKNKDVCIEALQRLEQVVPLAEYDYLIITGGTSAAWNDMIREYFSGMSTLKIISGNQNDTLPFAFANVRGYFMYRYGKLMGD